MISLLHAIILGIVEGITEFLPISSTGHLVVASNMLKAGANAPEAMKAFDVVIQLGAIIAVVWFYRAELFEQVSQVTSEPRVRRLWLNLLIAFVPVALIGLKFHHLITEHLFTPTIVAMSFILGGVVLWWVDRNPTAHDPDPEEPAKVGHLYDIMPRHALVVGLCQILSLIPGVSRSGSTIVGGMLSGLDRETATAFSFFLSIPTLGAATIYEGWKERHTIMAAGDALPLAVGTFVSFVVALLAIGWLLRFVSRNDFRGFAAYRIVAGLLILTVLSGYMH